MSFSSANITFTNESLQERESVSVLKHSDNCVVQPCVISW